MPPTVVTAGTFDGVHLGHRAVLRTVSEIAAGEGLRPLAVTFDRHPLEVIAPSKAPGLLMHPDRRDALIREAGCGVLRLPFDNVLRSMTCRQWLEWLRDTHGAEAVVLGYDNTFGSDGRNLSRSEIADIAALCGLRAVTAPEIEGCSSTSARKAVKAGAMEHASSILGRPFMLEGTVAPGRRIGRTIGFPTANLQTDPRLLLPGIGVYEATAGVAGRSYPAVVNVGSNPTVSPDAPVGVEAHLIDLPDGTDLYGLHMTLAFGRRLRGERRFDSLEALKSQIAADVASIGR